MNSSLKTRGTQLAGLLLLAAWWTTSASSAWARPLPPGDPGSSTLTTSGAASTPLAASPIVVHDHPSVWVYLLVASLAVALTLAAVWAIRTLRRAASGRQAKGLQPA